MSNLERHCRLLLRAYPAAYREARGEEIMGTLLEATPPGRPWPLPRDIRCLIFGGLRARAAQPRQFTTATNLRVAVLAGVAAYLAFSASGFLSSYVPSGYNVIAGRPAGCVRIATRGRGAECAVRLAARCCRAVADPSGARLAESAPCRCSPRRVARSCGDVLRRAVAGHRCGSTVVGLACLAALVAVAGYAERPSWRWFWPLGLLAIAPLLVAVARRFAPTGADVVLAAGVILAALAVSILSIAWMVIDARPAIAMAVFLLAIQLSLTISLLAMGDRSVVSPLFALVVIAIMAVAVWRLRRQSARGEPA